MIIFLAILLMIFLVGFAYWKGMKHGNLVTIGLFMENLDKFDNEKVRENIKYNFERIKDKFFI